MQRHEILDWLLRTAKRNLFGAGSWPADDETERTYWSLFNEHLTIELPDTRGRKLNEFALEIDLPSMAAFVGVNPEECLVAFTWDRDAEFDNLFDRLENGAEEDGNELVRQYLRGAYVRYCTAREICPFQPVEKSLLRSTASNPGHQTH